jgi:hypothetical protein
MPIRHFLTAGVAFATAGVIAAVPAIAPPLTPRDVQVVKSTEVELSASLYQTLVNTFFGAEPDTAAGFPGLAQLLLRLQAGGDVAAQNAIQGFFDVGASEVLRQYLTAANPSFLAGVAAINTFFNGGGTNGVYDLPQDNASLFGVSGLVYLRLLAAGLAPEQQQVINDLFQGGFSQVVETQLLSRTTDPDQTQFIEDFFEGGVTQNVYTSLLAATTDPQQLTVINDFFTGGATQVVKTQLTSRTTDPNQLADINAFFPDPANDYAGGISENVRIRLLAATTDPDQQAFINEYFDNGISGAIRFLLAGPAPVVVMAKSAAPEAATFSAAVVEDDPAPAAVVAKDPTPAAAVVAKDPAPAAAVAADPAPAAEAAPAPDPKPKFTAKISEKAADEEEAVDTTDGNKAEPIIIVGNGGAKPGSGSWGIFGQIAQAIHDTIANAGKPAAPADSTGSETSGAESGGS